MLLFVLFCLVAYSSCQKKENRYMQAVGLQNFEIKDILIKNLTEKQKLTITLTYEDGDMPILLVCEKQPSFLNTTINYEQIKKENCMSDINSFDQGVQLQIISLLKVEKSQAFQKNFNIYQIQSFNLFVGAYSQLSSTFNISAQIQSLYSCTKECKNGGNCFYGLCECKEGTFGDDCSILGIDIKDQQKLSPNLLYYLNLYSTGTTFQRILSNQIPLRQQCYVETPFIDQGSMQITNLLQLTLDKIEICKNLTLALEGEVKVKLNAYFTFKLYSQYDVIILITKNDDGGLEKIMMIIFIPLSILFFFLLICCCVKLYKNQLQIPQNEKKDEQVDVRGNENKFMPNYKFQQVKETIQEDLNEKEFECSICLEKFTLDNDVKVTYCKHIYHSLCLQMWLKKIKICPLCRAPLDEATLATLLIPQKSQTFIDQISNKLPSNNKLKINTLTSFSNINRTNNQNAFQHLNYQRSLVLLEQ